MVWSGGVSKRSLFKCYHKVTVNWFGLVLFAQVSARCLVSTGKRLLSTYDPKLFSGRVLFSEPESPVKVLIEFYRILRICKTALVFCS